MSASMIQAEAGEKSSPVSSPVNRSVPDGLNRILRLISSPQRTSEHGIDRLAKGGGHEEQPSNSAPAAIFHFTQAESAKASSEITRIQIQAPAKIAQAIQRLCSNHPPPASADCTPNRIRPGTQVIERKQNQQDRHFSDDILGPRERPREVERQGAVARSSQTRPGPTKAVRMNARKHWTPR